MPATLSRQASLRPVTMSFSTDQLSTNNSPGFAQLQPTNRVIQLCNTRIVVKLDCLFVVLSSPHLSNTPGERLWRRGLTCHPPHWRLFEISRDLDRTPPLAHNVASSKNSQNDRFREAQQFENASPYNDCFAGKFGFSAMVLFYKHRAN